MATTVLIEEAVMRGLGEVRVKLHKTIKQRLSNLISVDLCQPISTIFHHLYQHNKMITK